MEIAEYLSVAPEQVLKAVARQDEYECIIDHGEERERVFISFDDLVGKSEPMPEPETEPVEIDATNGARELAEEHGLDLAELYNGERLTYWDVQNAVGGGE